MSAAQRTALRLQVRQCHLDLDQAAAPWLHKRHGSKPGSPALRLYLHAACVEDITIQSVLRERAPLFTSFMPALGGPADVVALRQYARAVYAATDAYLAQLPPDGLSRLVDLRELGPGRRTVAWVTRRFVVQELGYISNEIADTAHHPSERLQLVR